MKVMGIDAHVLLEKGLHSYCIVDIRGEQSFLASHLSNALHLPRYDLIMDFIETKYNKSLHIPLLIMCFSALNAKKMAQHLADTMPPSNYPIGMIYYLTCGIMELEYYSTDINNNTTLSNPPPPAPPLHP